MSWLDDVRYLARDAASRLTETAEEIRRDHTVQEAPDSTHTRTEVGEAMQYWNAQAEGALNTAENTFSRVVSHQAMDRIRMGFASGMMAPAVVAGTGATLIDMGRNLAHGRVRDVGRTLVATLANPFVEVAAGIPEGISYLLRRATGDRQRNAYRDTQAEVNFGMNVLAAGGLLRGSRALAAGRAGQAAIGVIERGTERVAEGLRVAAERVQNSGQQPAYATANISGRAPTASTPTTPSAAPDLSGPTVAMMQGRTTSATGRRPGTQPARPTPEEFQAEQASTWTHAERVMYHLKDLMDSAFSGRGQGSLSWRSSVSSFFDTVGESYTTRMSRFGNTFNEAGPTFQLRRLGPSQVEVQIGSYTRSYTMNLSSMNVETFLTQISHDLGRAITFPTE